MLAVVHEYVSALAAAHNDDNAVNPALTAAAEDAMVAAALADCPAWCTLDHDKVIRECLPEGAYEHRRDFGEVEWASGERRGALYVDVSLWHHLDGTTELGMFVNGDVGGPLTAAQAVELGRSVALAAQLLVDLATGGDTSA